MLGACRSLGPHRDRGDAPLLKVGVDDRLRPGDHRLAGRERARQELTNASDTETGLVVVSVLTVSATDCRADSPRRIRISGWAGSRLVPLALTTTSPAAIPAWAATPPAATASTSTPAATPCRDASEAVSWR